MKNTLLALTALIPASALAGNRPNIIYICTDQQTATAMSCAGNTDIQTPNMDRLAEAGTLFPNAYCAAPLSGPSRTSMFTGCYPHRIGIKQNGTPLSEERRLVSLGMVVKEAGYDCIYAGKWHVHTGSMPNDGSFGFKTIHKHSDFGLAEDCVKFLDSRDAKDKKPFFLVASFDNPHNVCQLAREQSLPTGDVGEPDIKDCPGLPYNFEISPYDADVVRYEQKLFYTAYPTVNYKPDDWRRYRWGYFRLVERVDAEIGKIIDAVDRNGLWDNTVIIFTSDHGDGMGAHRWNQKSALYEEVVNIPFIVTLPGKKHAGNVMPQLICNGVDFYATVCDFAGAKVPDDIQGTSFKDVVLSGDPAKPHQEYVVTETMFDKGGMTRGWAVRTAHYKYVLYELGLHREQLYDMDRDRGEMRNLAMESKYDEELARHRQILRTWMKANKTPQVYSGSVVPGY